MPVLTRHRDANRNRASKTAGGVTQTYVYDDGDKLDEITVGGVPVKEYGYDAAGRTTSVTTSAGTTTLTYDYESRITGITYPSTATNSFTYNGLDTRVSKTDSAGTKTYRRDGAYVTDPVLSDGSSTFTPGISIRNGGATKFQHLDHQGSLLRQTDANENVTARKLYDAFGLEVQTQGTMVGPFGYSGGFGYQSDSDSGLMLLGHRYYDASTGRFLTRDPVKDGRNWYAYCDSNTLTRIDPAGLDWFYDQKTGNLYKTPGPIYYGMPFPDKPVATGGFSGRKGPPRNNPDYQDVIATGPIPKGRYLIGPISNKSPGGKNLPGCLPLTPAPENNMHGRSDFLIHGGSREGDPSEGCIIFPRAVRNEIADSEDRVLWVF